MRSLDSSSRSTLPSGYQVSVIPSCVENSKFNQVSLFVLVKHLHVLWTQPTVQLPIWKIVLPIPDIMHSNMHWKHPFETDQTPMKSYSIYCICLWRYWPCSIEESNLRTRWPECVTLSSTRQWIPPSSNQSLILNHFRQICPSWVNMQDIPPQTCNYPISTQSHLPFLTYRLMKCKKFQIHFILDKEIYHFLMV